MNKKIIISTIIILVCVLAVSAQVPPPGGQNIPPDGIPIDGGLGLLLAGMAGYAYKKFKKGR